MAKILDTFKDRELELGPLAGAPAGPWKHWRLARDADGIAWLGIDRAGASANTLNADVLSELNRALSDIESDLPKGLVIRSLKRSGFIAGADINQFRDSSAADVAASLTQAHAVIDRLDNLKIPTVAVIHGFCLGGGLEVALACKYRIATDDARLGFPEVMLGLHPGLGGTVRLPRLINPIEAMTAMLTGRNFRARRAKSLGLVDAVTQERHMAAAVKDAVAGKLKTARASMSVTLFNSALARAILAPRMRREAGKKAPEKNYPAPYALIDLWQHFGGDRRAMQRQEVASFGRLLATPTSQNLVRVFFLREKLKGFAGGKWAGQRVHVIGAGTMGADIAAWCAWNGLTVTLADMKPEPLGAAIKRAAILFKRLSQKSIEVRDALDRLVPDLKGEGVRSADLIIEAVPEVLGLKQKIFAATEAKMKPDAILATNTSSIPLEQLREGLKRPERFVGIHFFNPVPRLQLVEVVSHDKVAADVLAGANSFLGRIDKLPAPVKSEPGFLVNRVLMPYLVEALIMADEGIKKETIDRAAEDFGMPMGPIELADEVGLDICLHVADVLREQLPRPMPETPKWLRDKVEKGELGKKTGKGLYDWKDGKAVKAADDGTPRPDLADRLILPMLDVSVSCLRENIVADADTLDAAMIFATGFAPFRGGPINYARTRGVADIKATLERLAQQHGERFKPDPGWASIG
ncbi:MAG: 3-hydroxyacyl-CoA dehydrogenase NAD-binding domain-containing protein [Xanthobacteraceae bacterium]